jgi:hypothetical protein
MPPGPVLRGILEDDVDAPTREDLEGFISFLEGVQQASGNAFAFGESATPLDASAAFRMHARLSAVLAIADIIEPEIRLRAPDLLSRYAAVAPTALAVMRTTVDILTAAEQNAIGAAKGESLEERLQRSIDQAKRTAPVYLGSFAKFADDDVSDDAEP